jgi:RNA polymerase sigma factor (sigma-70 family)
VVRGEESSSSEFRLIESALAGNQRAYAKLMGLHKVRVYNLILRMVRNEEDAADLTQETFIKAFRALGRYRSDFAFKSWILKIASNTCLDFLRRSRPQMVSTEEVTLVEPSAGPAEELARRRIGARIEEAVQLLPENLRAAVVLRHQEGMSYEEISRILDVPIGTVKTWIKRGREILRERLKR